MDDMDENQIHRNRRELLRRLPSDIRTDAANRHVESLRTMPLHEVKNTLINRHTYDTMYHSFLAGWDHAMAIRSEEMLSEHTELHGKIMDYELQRMKDEGMLGTDG